MRHGGGSKFETSPVTEAACVAEQHANYFQLRPDGVARVSRVSFGNTGGFSGHASAGSANALQLLPSPLSLRWATPTLVRSVEIPRTPSDPCQVQRQPSSSSSSSGGVGGGRAVSTPLRRRLSHRTDPSLPRHFRHFLPSPLPNFRTSRFRLPPDGDSPETRHDKM